MQNKFKFGLSRKDNLLDLRNNKMVKPNRFVGSLPSQIK